MNNLFIATVIYKNDIWIYTDHDVFNDYKSADLWIKERKKYYEKQWYEIIRWNNIEFEQLKNWEWQDVLPF